MALLNQLVYVTLFTIISVVGLSTLPEVAREAKNNQKRIEATRTEIRLSYVITELAHYNYTPYLSNRVMHSWLCFLQITCTHRLN